LLYGDGVFEGMRSYGARSFGLQQHLDRLWNSAKAIWLEIPFRARKWPQAVEETLRVNKIQDGYVRLVVTRGVGTLGLDPNKTSHPQIIIITDHIELYPQAFYDKGLEIITVSTMRNHPAALSPRIKSLNYLNNILAKSRVAGRLRRGADVESPGPKSPNARGTTCFSSLGATC